MPSASGPLRARPSINYYKRTALDRAVTVRVAETDVRIAAREDLILLKLLAGREQDIADVKAIVSVSAELLDRDYIPAWARRLSIEGIERYFP